MAANGNLNLTVEVLDLSPKVIKNDLFLLFSYCGTVHSLHLHSTRKDQPQIAFVTFVQPFAYQTALLLNGAVVAGNPIQVLPLQGSITHPNPHKMKDIALSKENGGFLPIVQATFQSMASKGAGILNRSKVELEEKCKLVERGRSVVKQTRSAIDTMISNNRYLTNGPAAWVSEALNKASNSKCSFDDLNTSSSRRKDNTNQREHKQK